MHPPDQPGIRSSLFSKNMLLCVGLGFTSGMPLYVLIQLIPLWLRDEGVSLTDIGLFALVGLPYAWKFLWAPFLDLNRPPVLGRRRGWMLIFQLLLIALISVMGVFNPLDDLRLIAFAAIALAFASASQDIVVDGYRRELLSDAELGLGNSIHVQAYRISSLIPGSLSLVLADTLPWHLVFPATAAFMFVGVITTLFARELDQQCDIDESSSSSFLAPFAEYVDRKGLSPLVLAFAFMVLYKLGDNMATALAMPFYLETGFTKTEIGLVAKHAALWPAIVGGIVGGVLMLRLGINRALWMFGLVQMFSILGYAVLSESGAILWLLAVVISFEYLGVGMGTAALTAFIARETSKLFAATQFALFTAITALPRTFANASTGVIVESVGWTNFFLLCTVLALPGMVLLIWVAPWRESD